MTIFEAYLVTTLIPNLGTSLEVLAFIMGVAAFAISFFWFMNETMPYGGGKPFPRSLVAVLATLAVIIGVTSSLFPSTKQMAAIIALKVGTSTEAREIYGESGDFLKAWLKEQTQQLTKESE